MTPFFHFHLDFLEKVKMTAVLVRMAVAETLVEDSNNRDISRICTLEPSLKVRASVKKLN